MASDGSPSIDQSSLTLQDDSGHSLLVDSGSVSSSSRASPARGLRTMASDLSSSTMSSSTNLGIPGNNVSSSSSSSSHLNGGRSLADESMISFVSTAPTSLYPGSTSSSSENDREMFSLSNGRANEADGTANEEEEGRRAFRELPEEGNKSIMLRDLSFLLDVAPHTVVEPLGLGTQSRLLAADWTSADENAQRADESTYEGVLVREARAAATSKVSDTQDSSSPSSSSNQGRGQYVIDQLAPIRIFDRQALAETQASEVANRSKRRTKGGLTLSSSSTGDKTISAAAALAAAAAGSSAAGEEAVGDENSAIVKNPFRREGSGNQSAASAGGNHHQNLYDVIDPVALLGSLVN